MMWTQHLKKNKAQMADSVNNVKSGSLTYAVRDTKIDGVEIKKTRLWA